MRGCVFSLVLLFLVGMNGYSLWQIARLRAEVAQLRRHVEAIQVARRESPLEAAQAALEAIRTGEWTRARDELDRLSGLLEGARTMASRQRAELQGQVARASAEVSKRGAKAADTVETILHGLLANKSPEEEAGN